MAAFIVSQREDHGVPHTVACRALGWCGAGFRVRNAVQEFEIIQSAHSLHLQHRSDWKPVWVRGHPGQAAAGMITWREQGLTDLISAIGGLTPSQLIAIANSAPA